MNQLFFFLDQIEEQQFIYLPPPKEENYKERPSSGAKKKGRIFDVQDEEQTCL